MQMFTSQLGMVPLEGDVPIDHVFWQRGNLTISMDCVGGEYWVRKAEGEKELEFMKLRSLGNALSLIGGWIRIVEDYGEG